MSRRCHGRRHIEHTNHQRTSVLVIGAGLGGVRTAEALRRRGYTGSITVVGGEDHQRYDRPPLTNAVLRREINHTTFPGDLAALDLQLHLGAAQRVST